MRIVSATVISQSISVGPRHPPVSRIFFECTDGTVWACPAEHEARMRNRVGDTEVIEIQSEDDQLAYPCSKDPRRRIEVMYARENASRAVMAHVRDVLDGFVDSHDRQLVLDAIARHIAELRAELA